MALVGLISKYVTILFIMIVILALIFGVIAYYLLKVKKIASKEEQFDYSRFDRRDSLEYVRFQNIINSVENNVQTHNGLIVADDGYRYIAGLKVSGYNFFSASAEEQKSSMIGMLSFLNTIEGDIQYRQSTKAIDLSENIEAHRKRLKEVAFEIEGLKLDHQDMVSQSENYLDNPEIYANYDKRISEIERTIKCKQHTLDELDIVIQYMEALSGTNIESEKVQCWLFEWNYNSNDYTEDLTDEERYEVAAQALTTKANSYISALSRTGCTCERMTGEELFELFRYHYSPITADAFTMNELYNSSVNALYITSDSLSTLEEEAKDEKEYYKIINQEREEEYAQETLEQLEETMELFTDEEALVVSDDSVDNLDEQITPAEFVSAVQMAEDDDDLVIDLDDDFVEEPITNKTPSAEQTSEDTTPFNVSMPTFSFAPEPEEDDEPIEIDEPETPIATKSTASAPISPAPTVTPAQAPEEQPKPKKKRFRRDKKKNGTPESEAQMSIFDSVPFGNI